MNKLFSFVLPALGAITLFFTLGHSAQAAAPTNFLFIGDLNTGTLLRYDAEVVGGNISLTPYGLNGNTSDPAYIIGQGVTEGVHGTGNTLITSQHIGSTWYISRFDRETGAFINHVSAQTFGGIGNLALTNDAKTAYVPDEAGDRLWRIDIATGVVLSSVAMTGVHDVQIGADGFIYATAYRGSSGVRRYSADLSSFAQIVADGDNGLNRPAGVVISGNTLYVAQNSQTINAKVYQYTLNGSSAATYNTQVTSSLLSFSFGMEMGPDGNLYVAVPGTFTGQGGPNQIVELNLSNGFSQANTAVTSALTFNGTDSSSTYKGAQTSVIWPKYIKFSSNFAQANDPGYTAPEPGSIALFLTAGLPLAGVVVRRRRRAA